MSRPGARALAAAAAIALVLAALHPPAASAEVQTLVFIRPQPSGPPGATVVMVGLGFPDGQPVEVRWGSVDGVQLARAGGPDFAVDLLVPDVSPGLYTLVVASRAPDGVLASAESADFLVTPPGSPQPVDELSPASTVPVPGSAEAATATPGYLWALIAIGLVTLAVVAWWGRPGRQRAPAALEDGPEPS